MSYTLREIESQAQVWASVLTTFEGSHDDLKRTLANLYYRRIVVIGCGSTYYLAQSVAQLLSIYTTIPAQAYPSSEIWLFPELIRGEDTLLLAISRSGTTTETINAVESFRGKGKSPILVITCYPDSPLARLADFVLAVPEAQEQSMVQTRSFTSMYISAVALVSVLSGRLELLDEIHKLPAFLEQMVMDYGDLPELWAKNQNYQQIFFLGNGQLYGLACEAMLKVKEMSLSRTEAYHTLEFRHGPMSLVDHRTLIVGLLSKQAEEPEIEVLKDLEKLGASIVLCSMKDTALNGWNPAFHIAIPGSINEWLSGILYLPLLQRLGYHRAVTKNLNPDQPTHLQAVIQL